MCSREGTSGTSSVLDDSSERHGNSADTSGMEPKKEPDSPELNGQTKLDDSPGAGTGDNRSRTSMFSDLHSGGAHQGKPPSLSGMPTNGPMMSPPQHSLMPPTHHPGALQPPPGLGHHHLGSLHTGLPSGAEGMLHDYQNL